MRVASLVVVCLWLGLVGCRKGKVESDTVENGGDIDVGTTTTTEADLDGDGYTSDDCDDGDARVNPGAIEYCDGVDNDCDGTIDEADAENASTWYTDGDGDGYGVDDGASVTACDDPGGYADESGDCDDADPAFHPNADETDCADPNDYNCDGSVGYADVDGDGWVACEECDDATASTNPDAAELCNEVDDDCDGTVDDGLVSTWYRDGDGDGYGDAATGTDTCTPEAGMVEDGTDCDDGLADVYPGAPETCTDTVDKNCDGSVGYADLDADGYAACEECDDADAAVNPGANEICNGIDDNCDGAIDEGGSDTWYADADGDGYGDASVSTTGCTAPSGYVADGSDCDDADATIHPGATETCTDTVDLNCDGSVGFADADGDGWAACEECDDGDAGINPDAPEVCDGVDQDCDGTVDDGVTSTFYADADGDGYGDPIVATDACTAASGYVADDTDCDDTDASVHPAATEDCASAVDLNCDGSVGYVDADADGWAACEECDDGSALINPDMAEVCNGVDDDCDGVTDDVGTDVFYADADGDGYGDASVTTVGCSAPAGYVADGTDCDDADYTVHPGASEDCTDPVDLNCDGSVGYADADADGWAACLDCDDTDAAVSPDAVEACNGYDDDCDGTTDEDGTDVFYVDADADGFGDVDVTTTGCSAPSGYVADDTDCDDTEATINPAAAEACNGVDDNCDGAIDESGSTTWYADADGDGYGDAGTTVASCTAPSGYVADATDCDDADATVHPAAPELCDGVDDDCDGSVDNGVTTSFYADADGDGYGDAGAAFAACSAPAGYVADGTDCDDADATINPGATESCTDRVDLNCDGSVGYSDADGDGYAACEECDDADAAVHPGATETCDGVDDDCDGTVDVGATDASTWYVDADLDGYGDAGTTASACTAPAGYVADDTDCDDATATVNPSALESCNGVDDDCDGATDETGSNVYYRDADGDGYGDAASTTTSCSAPTGFVSNAADCDDARATVNPGAAEACDGLDNDCDGTVDDGVTTTWYADADGDGYGGATTTSACAAPSGYVATSTDCDDGSAGVNPGATEICNSVDDDCDGAIDEGTASTFYRDGDGDGYGGTTSTTGCTAPSGYVTTSTDCDDGVATVHPGATETCNAVDDDCDGSVDEGALSTWYVDADGDGFGGDATTTACSAPSGYVSNTTDCDDAAATTFPGATETCNAVDDDCDGSVDEGATSTWYEDTDGDGYGTSATSTSACSAPAGYVADATDCDDTAARVNPGAAESCNGVDDDCDGSTDEGVTTTWYRDADGDGYGTAATSTTGCSAPSGYVASATDCNDASATVFPSATEICNAIDDDCDGSTDEGVTTTWYRDADGDGYGTSATSTSACSAPSGYVALDTDCNDANASINPGATESCTSAVDLNCDGSVSYADADGDGYAACTECDDGDASVHPGATETCNGIDDDCDGTVDPATSSGASTWYRDADSDGYGTSATSTTGCTAPSGYVASATDCNDASASVHPSATETCNSVDDDCDGSTDEGVTNTYYRDADGDLYGSTATTAACSAPAGYVVDGGDCDDTDALVNPSEAELCNGYDDDCDGLTDDASAIDASDWYYDGDRDGYGATSPAQTACDQPAGYVADATDCNDAVATVNPGAAEVCNSVDDDCDGSVDEGLSVTWYRDADGDGYGTSATTASACAAPSGYVSAGTDCDDATASVNPGATEVCNGIDDDCDGTADAGLSVTWYADADGDGFGDATVSTTACIPPSGYVTDDTDCDDTDPLVYPGATEYDDLADNDCDGWIDEDFVVAGDIVISEVDKRLGRGAPPRYTAGQWFELYNSSSRTVALQNWYFYRYNATDGADWFYVDPADAVFVGPGEYLVFCKSDDFTYDVDPTASTLVCDYYWGDETQPSTYQGTYHSNAYVFARNADLFQVYIEGDTTSGRVVDDVEWIHSGGVFWPNDASQSMSLDPANLDATSNDTITSWCSNSATASYIWYSSGRTIEYGTPGAANYDCP